MRRRTFLELESLSCKTLDGFIEEAVQQDEPWAFFLLGKAAAYTDVAFVLEQITQYEAEELLARIEHYLSL